MAASANVLTATDTGFESEVLKSQQLCIVDFWAEWCGPCRILGPTIDSLASEYTGKVKVFKMNVDENPDVPSRYHIRGIPTVIFFKGGQVVEQMVGVQPKEAYQEAIARHQ